MAGMTRRNFIKSSLGTAMYLIAASPLEALRYPQESRQDVYEGFIKEPAPEKFGELVENHLEEIRRKIRDLKIGKEGLDQGQMIFNDNEGKVYNSLEKACENVRGVLYDTGNENWLDAVLNLFSNKYITRSVVGDRNEEIRSVGFLFAVPETPEDYERFEKYLHTGTISPESIIDYYSRMWEIKLTTGSQQVIFNSEPYLLGSRFSIEPTVYSGPYEIWGQPFEVNLLLKPENSV